MTQILINQIAVGIFLIITLWVGLQSKRANSMEEYATAGRSLSSGVLMISLIATLICSKDIWLERSFDKGFITLAHAITIPVIIVLAGYFIYPEVIRFNNCHTLSGIIDRAYGLESGILSSIISIIFSLFIICSQLKFVG